MTVAKELAAGDNDESELPAIARLTGLSRFDLVSDGPPTGGLTPRRATALAGRLPRPFLKWAGGKGQLLKELFSTIDSLPWSGAYHEPFVGGGALFFELSRNSRIPSRAILADVNVNLIECYEAVRSNVAAVIALLHEHAANHSAEHYYRTRSLVPRTLEERAARVIYMNKTCFNGLYRENRRGEFNVPIGDYVNPNICDEPNLRACSRALQPVVARQESFESVLGAARAGDLVYFDPPYVPLSETSSFTAYARDGFDATNQQHLADVFRELDRLGALVMLSNSSTPLVKQLYCTFPTREVMARRSVNSKGNRRGDVPELIVTNFR